MNNESTVGECVSTSVCPNAYNAWFKIPQSYRHPKWLGDQSYGRDRRLSDAIDREEALLTFTKFHGSNGTTIRGVIGYCTDGLTVDSIVWEANSGLFVFTAVRFPSPAQSTTREK